MQTSSLLYVLLLINISFIHSSDLDKLSDSISHPVVTPTERFTVTLPIVNLELNLKSTELLTNQPMEELIEKRTPWILALCHVGASAAPQCYSAVELECKRKKNNSDPCTGLPITGTDYYALESVNQNITVQYLGNDIVTIAENGLDYLQEKNYEIAKKTLRAAALLGDHYAAANLGFLYKECHNTEGALYWFEQAAQMGLVDAMGQTGNLYHQLGKMENAIYWFKKAAEHDHIMAMINLAYVYRKTGMPECAMIYYAKAAQMGCVSPELFYTLSFTNNHHLNNTTLTQYANTVITNLNRGDTFTKKYQNACPKRFEVALQMLRRYTTKPIKTYSINIPCHVNKKRPQQP